jgi:hypothetical protein
MRLKTAATVLRVLADEDLKYSVILAVLEFAALAAAEAKDRQLVNALRVEVRRVPVQSD